MKVGIITMAYKRNYGGVLQSYALFKTIEGMGVDVEIIDFEYSSSQNEHPLVRVRSSFTKLLKLFGMRRGNTTKSTRELPDEHVLAFSTFKSKYLKYSKTVTNADISKIVNDYDVIVVGSDQIWNNVEGDKLFYFFDFNENFRGKRVAYAPCAVHEGVPYYNRIKLRKLLKKMDSISVRDQTTWNLVNKVSGLTPQIVLDPSCLYDYKEFAEKAPIIEGDYVFAYILGSEIKGGHDNIISMIRERYGPIKVVAAIIPNVSLEVEKFADRVMYNATPDDWVNMIAHSKFVYTDSFHGCMFSLKYHKPFFAYYKDSHRASRLKDIKNMYGLQNVFMSGEQYFINDVDYQSVDAILTKQREDSLAFLGNSIKL